MTLVPKREYLLLLIGDIAIFTLSLYLTLALRYFEWPAWEFFKLHLLPFAFLFAIWIAVFFLAGLYGRHTRLFRSRLSAVIFYTQAINIILTAVFFFFIPVFGLAPKTILLLYLAVSFVLVFLWRAIIFTRIPRSKKLRGVLIAAGADARSLAEEVTHDPHAGFRFEYVVDTHLAPTHEIIQHACRVAAEDDVSFLVVDFSDKAVSAALPIIYDAAFHKKRFGLIDAADLYEEMFERVPLSLIGYEWVLSNVSASRIYDVIKRVIDVLASIICGVISLPFYPIIALAIKLDDGGDIFVFLPRVGRYQETFYLVKFRSMTGNDAADYGEGGKSKLTVTRVGTWMRALRIDEIPQLWNIFRGDLSFVGPRPEAPTLSSTYSARIPYYNARYLIQPGLTGWAQIRHDRHPHHGVAIEETKEKLSYDLYYLKNRSLLLDIFVMLQTIRIVLTARGS